MRKKDWIVSIVCSVFSVFLGLFSVNAFIGISTLISGFLCAYFASEGKRINYVFGFINYLLIAYISFHNHLYGIVFFYTLVFAPSQIIGFFSWKKSLDINASVKAKSFTLKVGALITILCVLGSLVVGYLLSLIPYQQLAFLDASSNCINLCGIVLMILRYKEGEWLWFINNTIDLIIWIIAFMSGGPGSVIALLSSIGFLVFNIYGIWQWNLRSQKERQISSTKPPL